MMLYFRAFLVLNLLLGLSEPVDAKSRSCKVKIENLANTSIEQFENAAEVINEAKTASIVLQRNINCKSGILGWKSNFGYNYWGASTEKITGQTGYITTFMVPVQPSTKFVFNKVTYSIDGDLITGDIVYSGAIPGYQATLYNLTLNELEFERIVRYYQGIGRNVIVPVIVSDGENRAIAGSIGFSNEIVAVYNLMQNIKNKTPTHKKSTR